MCKYVMYFLILMLVIVKVYHCLLYLMTVVIDIMGVCIYFEGENAR